jgi:hypothetical protein
MPRGLVDHSITADVLIKELDRLATSRGYPTVCARQQPRTSLLHCEITWQHHTQHQHYEADYHAQPP